MENWMLVMSISGGFCLGYAVMTDKVHLRNSLLALGGWLYTLVFIGYAMMGGYV
jgi:hypothetical protein